MLRAPVLLLAVLIATAGCSSSGESSNGALEGTSPSGEPSNGASEPTGDLVATCSEPKDGEPVVLSGTQVSIDGDLLKVVWETGGPESPFPDANYYLSLSTQSAESLNNADHPPDPEYWLTASVVDGVAAPDGLSVADATSADLPALWTGTAVVSGATVTARMPLSATPGIESAFRWNAGFQALVDANYGESFCPSDGSFLEYPPQ